jgi:hypothetical protein
VSLNDLGYSWNDPIIHQFEISKDVSETEEKTLVRVPWLDKSRIDSAKSIQMDRKIRYTILL